MSLETDYLSLVDAIRNPNLMPWDIRPLIEESTALLPRCPNLQNHCKREANMVVDRAAKTHRAFLLPSNWEYNPLLFLRDLLYFDIMQNATSNLR